VPFPYVLVVEDDVSTQRGILKLLAVLRYEAAAVTTAVAALDEIEKREPAVVLSDFLLPEFDALWLLKQLRARWPDLPVILTTGAILPESSIREAKENGVVLLGKPFTREELDHALLRAIRPLEV
jgi:CheY-like chemotaxis protein